MKKIINSIFGNFDLRIVKKTKLKKMSNNLGYISAKKTVKNTQNEGQY